MIHNPSWSYTPVFLYRFIAVLPSFKEDTVFDWINLFALTNTYATCSNDYVPAWSLETTVYQNLSSTLLTVGYVNRKRLHSLITTVGLRFHIDW